MHWRLDKYVIDQTSRYLRRVFRYNSQWTNKDIEIVQFASGSEGLVFEQFFEENEKYPILTIASSGGQLTPTAFNDIVDQYDADTIVFGARAQAMVTIGNGVVLKAQVPATAYGEVFRAVQVYNEANNSNGLSGNDILVQLWRNYTTPASASVVASGSILGHTRTSFDYDFVELFPAVQLSGQDYWLTFQTPSGSLYDIGIDLDVTSTTYAENSSGTDTFATGSVTGGMLLPSFFRYGGSYEPTVLIKVIAKNDTATARTLAELSAQYLEMAKHAQLVRNAPTTDNVSLAMLQELGVSEYTEKGIYIKNISIRGPELRRRGENDNIFTVTVSVEMFLEYFQDYPAGIIKAVLPTVETFHDVSTNVAI